MPPRSKKRGIPDRWLDYKAVGKRLDGTRFIAFKVPLKQSLNSHLPASEVFGPLELLDALRKDHQELGLIIDLTFTTRYYKLQDLPDSLMWLKIFTAGHEVPSNATILSFKRAVRRFLRENAHNDLLIGVHCTHGLNRTGYLICRYLIDVDGMDPKKAIELFRLARGHAIERENYLRDLHCGPKRSNYGIDEPEQEPLRGHAVHRPCPTPSSSDASRRSLPHVNEPWCQRVTGELKRITADVEQEAGYTLDRTPVYRRTLPHRQMNYGLPYSLPRVEPHQALPPKPPSHPAMVVPQQPYRWAPPHSYCPDIDPFHSQQSRTNCPPVQSRWKSASQPSQRPLRWHSSTSWIRSKGYGHAGNAAGLCADFVDPYTH
ncbi:RNA/RNP complex-1-interacting phosphatase [Thalassophryne amazonica]|uniref:RNA/RNP complex-1-interacting phosphatase n=1 Tax=Thalassophryne amazonica TaxID=390379 RepID=UPI0014724597|nr:RNA/RNP complex-1-interacting phosphatase [Thalassophryne amazonica]